MTFLRAPLVALLLALVGAGPAAAGVRLVARDEPVGAAARAALARAAPLRFDLVGLHWRGSGSVWFRARTVAGSWSIWQPARPEAEDLPDPGTPEARARPGWKLGNPYWTGASNAIEYRLRGEVTRLRAFFVQSPADRASPRATAPPAQPAIITRARWGADESIVRAPPYYASRVRFAVVHHTAGTNSYSRAQSAAIVRGIQRYHVQGNGWNDIGYNFLVDKYGQVFEGRGGGIAQNVVGAHAEGFNTGSTGVSVLGTYSSTKISRTARAALVKLLSWRLDVAHVDPLARMTWTSGGNPQYPAGMRVSLRAISGHRDTGPTSCPGSALYGQLPSIARQVAARGLPKLYDPEVRGALGGPVHVTGRLSSPLSWSVIIRAADGSTVASGAGSGESVDWTWDASAFPYGTYTYTVEAEPAVRPWTAPVPGPPTLAVKRVRASPPVLTPNGDGVAESTSISFVLTTAAKVSAVIVDGSGSAVRRLASGRPLGGGTRRLYWNGRNGSGALAPDGRYSLEISAQSPGQTDSTSHAIVVDRTLGSLAARPEIFSPNADGRVDAAGATFHLSRAARVLVRVMRGGVRIATLQPGRDLSAGTQSLSWNGRTKAGSRAADGTYTIRVDATTSLGRRSLGVTVRLDTTVPVVHFVHAVASRRTFVTLSVSEPGRLRIWFGTGRISLGVAAGMHAFTYARRTRVVQAALWDKGWNRSATARSRVKLRQRS